MGREVSLGAPLGGPLGGALGLRPATGGGAPAAPTLQVLLVGGGGAGDRSNAIFRETGGGGGGEVLELEIAPPAPGTYDVVVGLGGVVLGAAAGLTRFGGILKAVPGGSGAAHLLPSNDIRIALRLSGFSAAASGTVTERAFGGFLGGLRVINDNWSSGGGGGGAGGPGGNASQLLGGLGGVGRVSSITGLPVEYGPGGRGGSTFGGAGLAPVNPGDGGGGAVPGSSTGGFNGANGLFVARYLTGTQSWTGGNITVDGPWTIHTFTADGTFTRTA